jgi:hypothetical protein
VPLGHETLRDSSAGRAGQVVPPVTVTATLELVLHVYVRVMLSPLAAFTQSVSEAWVLRRVVLPERYSSH